MEKGKERLFSFKTSGLTKSINLIKEVEFRIVLPRIFRKNNKLNKFNGSSSVNSSIRSVESSNSFGSSKCSHTTEDLIKINFDDIVERVSSKVKGADLFEKCIDKFAILEPEYFGLFYRM